MPDTSRISKGRRGENIAAEYLVRQGFVLLERNYRRLGCEVDIIAMDGGTTVFIEVKARSSRTVGLGREAVTYAKQRNIIKAASAYLTENGLWDAPVRSCGMRGRVYQKCLSGVIFSYMGVDTGDLW